MDVEETGPEVAASAGSTKEEVAPNNDNEASSSPGRSSPDTNCPICLGKLENKSFTDSCLHQFCFKCLLEWSKVKAECPLCKQSFKSIIHNVRSIEDYEQYYLSTSSTEGTLFVSREIFARLESPDGNYRGEAPNYRFRSATTAVSSYLDYFVRLEEAITHRVLPPGPSISGGTLWQRRRQRGTSDFRRNIYQLGMWVQRTSDITGRVRECSPEFYRANPAQVHRLVPWLNRELNVLLYENSPHIQHVMSRILELITQVPIRSPGFAAVIAPYIGRNTEHFIHEFHSFAISPYDLVGYDRHAGYVGRSQIIDYNSSHESDSDVQVLEEDIGNPSPLIQLVETDSDDCIVLDTPIRTQPEVITLDSDDDVVQITQPPTKTSSTSTSQTKPSTSQSGQSSTSLYKPSTSQSKPSTSQSKPSTSQPKPSTSQSKPSTSQSKTFTSQPKFSSSQPKPSTSQSLPRRPRLKRNWLTVNNIQMPSTSSSENIKGCEISISIAHSSRSLSPLLSDASEDSSSSWVPVSRKPTKVKKKKCMKRRSHKKPSKAEKVVSESEDESSPGPVARRKRPATLLVTSDNSDTDRTFKASELPTLARRKHLASEDSTISKDSDRLYIETDVSSGSSSELEHKPRLKSVVVKSHPKPEQRTVSPCHCKSERSDYDSFSSRSYSDLPSSRSRSDSYRSTHSRRSRHSSSSSVERLSSKHKHSKKRSKREK